MKGPRGAGRIVLLSASTVSALVLLLSYPTSSGQWLTTGAEEVVAAAPGPGRGPGATATQAVTTTTDGAVVATRWGDVQVQVQVTDGVLSDVVALRLPDQNPRDVQINAQAEPRLRQEAVAAGSADIDVVSGATVTSDGYIRSLQSALDAAGVGA